MTHDVGLRRPGTIFPWMLGPAQDVLWFYVAPLIVGSIMFWIAEGAVVSQSLVLSTIAATGFGFGPLHQGATWFSFFDKGNRAYYSSTLTNRLAFFVAPPVLILLSIACVFLALEATIVIFCFWHVHHLIQQNVRFLALYQSEQTGEAMPNRSLEINSQWLAAVLFTLMSCARTNLFGMQNLPGLPIVIDCLAVIFVITCAGYLVQLFSQMRSGKSLNVPAFCFWIVSVLSMAPVAFMGKSYFNAFVIPLTLHWFQFLGFNAKLVKNKYTGENLDNLPVKDAKEALPFFVSVCVAFMIFFVSIQILTSPDLCQNRWIAFIGAGTVLGLGACHYILDTFLWRFKEPFQKQEILPYVTDHTK